MPKLLLFALTAAALFAADNPWKTVQDLKSGSELRIYRIGSHEPLIATFSDANDDRIVIVMKNEQTSIAKADIDRIDARPAASGKRKLTSTTTSKTTEPDFTPHPQPGIAAPGTSTSTSVSMGGSTRPDFATVYQRLSGAGKPVSPAQD